jgi:hypothetical protein
MRNVNMRHVHVQVAISPAARTSDMLGGGREMIRGLAAKCGIPQFMWGGVGECMPTWAVVMECVVVVCDDGLWLVEASET